MFQKGVSNGAPAGNKNAKKSTRFWSEAIIKELKTSKKARKLARKLIEMAEEGDMAAIREVGDRVEGKVKQIIGGEGEGGSITVKMIKGDDAL